MSKLKPNKYVNLKTGAYLYQVNKIHPKFNNRRRDCLSPSINPAVISQGPHN